MDAHERRLAANFPVHQGHGAFPFGFPFDAQYFKRAVSRRQLGARDDSDSALGLLARGARVLSFFRVA